MRQVWPGPRPSWPPSPTRTTCVRIWRWKWNQWQKVNQTCLALLWLHDRDVGSGMSVGIERKAEIQLFTRSDTPETSHFWVQWFTACSLIRHPSHEGKCGFFFNSLPFQRLFATLTVQERCKQLCSGHNRSVWSSCCWQGSSVMWDWINPSAPEQEALYTNFNLTRSRHTAYTNVMIT